MASGTASGLHCTGSDDTISEKQFAATQRKVEGRRAFAASRSNAKLGRFTTEKDPCAVHNKH